jgi:hypothetical protein
MSPLGSRWHLFEFMDLTWLPVSLRQVLRDILECGNGRPFRGYYDWAVDCIVRQAALHRADQVVELGAGTAPLTRRLAADPRAKGLKLVVCDLSPDLALYDALARQQPRQVQVLREPVDFSQPREWPPGTLLVLSATLHHVPAAQRLAVLEALARSGSAVLVLEPLRRTLLSALFVWLSLFPALLVPLLQWQRPGRCRRLVWCWLVPVAPLLFVWDGLVSCWRQWTPRQWQKAFASLAAGRACAGQVHQTLFCQQVVLRCRVD